jgi:hypothetical protein
MGINPSYFKGDNLPVETVNWFDAVQYCNARSQKEGLPPAYIINDENVIWNQNTNGYRLPTEAEWEYACRAGTTTAYNTGNSITGIQANCFDTHGAKTTNVGSFAPNAWGLYDMHGNVWEWCWDWHGEWSIPDKTSPSAPPWGSYRALRGGSWDTSSWRPRSATRHSYTPEYSHNDIGFRVARSIKPDDVQFYSAPDAQKEAEELAQAIPSQTATSDGFDWEAINAGVIITGYTGSAKDIILPPIIEKRKVVAIGKKAFCCKGITSAFIPVSVTSIGDDAFKANELTNVFISNSVISIGNDSFRGNKLTSVVIPDSVIYIGNRAFEHNQLTSVVIHGSCIFIGRHAFSNNELKDVIIPDGVISIRNNSFENNDLISVDIGKNISYIGDSAFFGNKLTSVVIPDSVTTIGAYAFTGNQLTSVVIGKSVASIGAKAFSFNNLTSVIIPDSVTSIGEKAFMNNALTSVTMPSSVELESDISSSGFTEYYNNNDKKAGLYTYNDFCGWKWDAG